MTQLLGQLHSCVFVCPRAGSILALGKSPRGMLAAAACSVVFRIFAIRAALAGRNLICRADESQRIAAERGECAFDGYFLLSDGSFAITRQSMAGVWCGCPDSAKSVMGRRWRGCGGVSLSALVLALA